MNFINLFRRRVVPPSPEKKPYAYEYNEFTLSLPEDWKQVSNADRRTLNWRSSGQKAEIMIDIDFDEVPESKWSTLAKINLECRHQALANASNESITVVHRGITPHARGVGLEMTYAAYNAKSSYIYLGYVTSRKIFNLALTSSESNAYAVDVYNKIMQKWLLVELP